MPPNRPKERRDAEIEELRLRLGEAQDALEAIRTGQVESLIVETAAGPRIFSLEGASHSYRFLVEAMSEGAATVSEDGTILYCNARFAEMVDLPLERVMGSALLDWVSAPFKADVGAMLSEAREGDSRGELTVRRQNGEELAIQISVSAFYDDGRRLLCLVATDLTEQKRNEQVLAEGRVARSVLEQAADAIVVCDEKGRITRASRAAEHMCGCSPLHAFFDVAYPVVLSSPLLAGGLASTALRGAVTRAEPASLNRVDGTRAELLVSAAPLHGPEHRIIGCVITMVDVTEHRRAETERKRAEDKLRENEGRLRSIMENMSEGLMLFDPEGNVTYQNPASLRLHGFEPDEVGRIEHADLPVTWKGWDENGRPVPLEEWPISRVCRLERFQGQVLEAERVDTGRRFIGSYNGCPIYDTQGKFLLGFITIRDITDEVRAKQELLRSHEGLSRLADGSLSVMNKTDLGDMLQAISGAALSLTGARLATCGHGFVNGQFVVGGSARATGAAECPPGTMFHLEKGGVHMVLAEGAESIRLSDAELRSHARWWGLPDSHVPMRGLLGVPIRNRGGMTNGVLLVTDKDQGDFSAEDEALLKQLATVASLALQHVEARISLEEADKRKNEFLAMLSHELRNPLAPVRNSLYILDRAAPGGEQARRALGVINRQVGHITHLVDDLLDVTRISRGKIQLQSEPLDFTDVVRRAVEDHRGLFAANKLALQVSIPDRQIRVFGDRTRIAQVIGNILGNAAKFTEPGGQVAVQVETNERLGQAVARVRDTGAGIAPEMKPRIFEPFTQADATLDRTMGGLGLGLALAKSIVEMHGGTVSVESEGLGKGAEFTVRFPLDSSVPLIVEKVSESSQNGRRRRVLVIEDNVDAAESLREVLEIHEHSVEVAFSGAEGIAKARAFKPEVVLCDLGLPGMNGYEVARAIRAEETLKSPSLVALTGYAAPEDIARSQAAGFVCHIPKPPSAEMLERILASLPSRQGGSSSADSSVKNVYP